MEYHIVTKRSIVNGSEKKEQIGHVTEQSDADYINENYYYDLYLTWLENNKSQLVSEVKNLQDFYVEENVDAVYSVEKKCNYLTSFTVQKINNITNL
jgi:hypothetical protein